MKNKFCKNSCNNHFHFLNSNRILIFIQQPGFWFCVYSLLYSILYISESDVYQIKIQNLSKHPLYILLLHLQQTIDLLHPTDTCTVHTHRAPRIESWFGNVNRDYSLTHRVKLDVELRFPSWPNRDSRKITNVKLKK